MTANPSLFPYDRFLTAPLARRSDPETAKAAARSIGRGAETAIMDAFNCWPELTDDELCAAICDLYAPTVKTARSRLSHEGILIDSGKREPSDRGRMMIVWRKA